MAVFAESLNNIIDDLDHLDLKRIFSYQYKLDGVRREARGF